MARAQSTDFYHAMKYHVVATGPAGTGPSVLGTAQAGFNTCVMPEATIEQVEYKEGIYVYRRKFPGDVTFSDITLTRGVVKKSNPLYDWIRKAYLGQEYRSDIQIRHFHRDDVTNLTDFTKANPRRIIKCFECLPIRVKPGSDFDAMSSEVSIQEIDIALEYFELEDRN